MKDAVNYYRLKWMPDGLGPASAVPVCAMKSYSNVSAGVKDGDNVRRMYRDYLLYERDVLDMFPKWKAFPKRSVCLAFMTMLIEDTEKNPKYLFSRCGRFYFTDPYSGNPENHIQVALANVGCSGFYMFINDFYHHEGPIRVSYDAPYEEQVKTISNILAERLS